MRQVAIEQFKRKMNEEVKDLPFEVTKRGEVLFVCKPHGSAEPHGSNHMVKDETHGSPIDAADFLKSVKKPLVNPGSRYDRPPLDLSVEAQAGGKMGH